MLSDTYIFYADVYFIQNFIIKIAVIYLSLFCNKLHFHTSTINGVGKILCASACGTIIEIIGLLFTNSYNVFLLLVHLLEIPIMFLGILGRDRKQIRQILVLAITGYFFLMLISSVVEMLWNWFGDSISFVLLLIFACGTTIIAVRIWKNYKQMQKGIFAVELLHRENRIQMKAFYDSGNSLLDPYTGKGVHIISGKVISKLDLDIENPVLVPYKSLGNEDGIIEVYYIEELIIEGDRKRIHKSKSPVGVTKENLFEGKAYEMILNEEVF